VRQATVLLLSVLIAVTGNLRAFGAAASGPTKSLMQAANDGDVDQIKRHIAANRTDFNAADQYGRTPLRQTIEGSKVEAAKVIIESGKANLDAKDRDGLTPLIMATTRGQKEIVEALVAKGADLNGKDGYGRTPLHAAITANQKEIATMLIEKGADLNAVDKQGQSPLTLARGRGQTDIVDLLTQRGAKEPANNQLSPYGNYAYAGNPAAPQGPGPGGTSAARPAVQVDPNAIKQQIKQFEGLAAALKTVDDKSEGEQQGWIQRRTDNRATLLSAVERQFEDEMVFVKSVATEEKSASSSVWKSLLTAVVSPNAAEGKIEKTTKAIDDLTAKRKKRFEQIGAQLRDQRRAAPAGNRQTGAVGGRAGVRGMRGRSTGPGATGSTGYSAAGPYGNTGTKMVQKRPDANEPAMDPETQSQIQVWLNAKPDDKRALLDAVEQMDLGDLDGLRQVAVEEQAKKTTAAVMGLMMVHEERVQKITLKWQEEDQRMQKLQGRAGPQGTPGTQQGQQPMRPVRRGR
jgi:hypothetical protein